jgi:hypothetical protein
LLLDKSQNLGQNRDYKDNLAHCPCSERKPCYSITLVRTMADPAYMHAAALAAAANHHSPAVGNFSPSPRPRTLSDKSTTSRRSRSPTSRTWSVKATDPRTSKLTARSLVRTSSLSPSRTRTPTTSSPARRLPQTPDHQSK